QGAQRGSPDRCAANTNGARLHVAVVGVEEAERHLVDLVLLENVPVVERQLEIASRLERDTRVEAVRLLGLQVRVTGEDEIDIGRRAQSGTDRAAERIGEELRALRGTETDLRQRWRTEAFAPRRAERQRVDRAPAQRHLRIRRTAEVVVVVVAAGEIE